MDIKHPHVLKWTAMGMRDEGLGEYVEKRDFDALVAVIERLKKERTVPRRASRKIKQAPPPPLQLTHRKPRPLARDK